ncbi:hypothetical protein KKG41_04425 [Patescibacteria group bacterium]|nr:hypothetical protein [Patescibacteria group bacterium]MBU1889924.1 hypothetical protein [Patescibacteria group bacterium]
MPFEIGFSGSSVTENILPFTYFWRFFIEGGWIFFGIALIIIGYRFWLLRKREAFIRSKNFILLAIDVPREIEPNLKAIEHIYSQFAGIYSEPNHVEKYLKGKVQLYLSLELVSIGGYIQFIIRTPDKYRDLVEAAFYAQYPEAVITEVEDYTDGAVEKFPNDKYELYGSGIAFNKPSPYPIKTYIAFEHSLSQALADPMASLLEILSKIKQGEQIWIQLVIRPKEKKDWLDEAQRIVNKIVGEKVEAKNAFGPLGAITRGAFQTVTASLVESNVEEQKQKDGPKNWLMQLTPGERSVVEAIQLKIAKKAYETKFRYIYLAEKEVVNKGIGINAMFGALHQFSAMDLNSFRPDKRTFTKTNFIFFSKSRLARRQRQLMKNFKMRQPGHGIILNTEELASIFHFPTENVKAPLVKKIDSKRGEPPVGLPMEAGYSPLKSVASVPQAEPAPPAHTPAPMAPQSESIPAPREQSDIPTDIPTKRETPPSRAGTNQPPPNLPFE